MSLRLGCPSLLASLLVVGSVGTAAAQSAEAAEAPPSPEPLPAPAPAPDAPAPDAPAEPVDDAVMVAPPTQALATPDELVARRALLAYGAQAKRARIAGGIGAIVASGASVGAGLYYRHEYDEALGNTIWITGATLGIVSIVGMIRPTSLETFAAEAQGMPAQAIQAKWAAMAGAAQRGRYIVGTFNTVLGAAGIGLGIAFAAGAADLDRGERSAWTTALLTAGAGVVASGVITLIVPSETEAGYDAVYGANDALRDVSFVVAPTPYGGGAAALQGRF